MVVVVVVVERRKASPIASKKKKRESEKKEKKHTHKNIKRICSRAGTTAGRVLCFMYECMYCMSCTNNKTMIENVTENDIEKC